MRTRYYNTIVGALILAVGLSAFGIGLWVGLDSASSQVKRLTAKDAERTKIIGRAFITVLDLEQKLKQVNGILKLATQEEEKVVDWNDEALEND